MRVEDLISSARETLTAERVYGAPYEKNGVTFIPAASIAGGGGGGTGTDKDGGSGDGAGFGATGHPAGAYVISGNTVTWQPAVDVNRLANAVATVAVFWLFTRVRLAKARARRR